MTIQLTDIMVFLPYTPRNDSDARNYDKWIREVDNPFFNNIRGITHYSNWKVKDILRGTVDYTHFDFMYLDQILHGEVWTNETLIEFAANWTRLWGVDPDNADLSVNYNSYKLGRVRGSSAFSRSGVTVAIGPQGDSVIGGSVWEVTEPMVGKSPVDVYEVAFGEPRVDAGQAMAQAIITGELIAAP